MVEEIAVGRDWVVVITDGDREALTGTPFPVVGPSCPPSLTPNGPPQQMPTRL
jgi:hypothetical protein